jgi:orotidine-5'-phosphate decarboxylase
MNYQQLLHQIKSKRSFLCVGLDADLNKMPVHIRDNYSDPVFEFNKAIIDATIPYTVAYKPNLAFYESLGPSGLESLHKTVNYLQGKAFTIADAKRGDIGNTAEMYAHALYNYYGFDAVTLSPYMGVDTIMPFLKYENKWSIVLALTSNPGAADFELLPTDEGALFEVVLKKFSHVPPEQLMFVAGATRPEYLQTIRKHVPDHFLLVPGVGAQGGSLEEVCRYGLNRQVGLLINSSRQIIYAGQGSDFDRLAARQANQLQMQMEHILIAQNIIS